MTFEQFFSLEWRKQQLREDKPVVDLFCRQYHVRWVGYEVTLESFPDTPWEMMYYFSDARGGYTLRGLLASLDQRIDG